ncbi:MAG: DNA-binding protein [Candidatus Micrarchaeia archaeon]|jgi:DNA-binding TFAR19-related protein (PDSD5 family)
MEENQQDNAGFKDAQKRRLEDLQKRQAAESQLKALVAKVFEPAAIGRLSNMRMSNENLYLQIVQYFVAYAQQGKLQGKVSEAQVKELATRLLSTRRQTTIRRA